MHSEIHSCNRCDADCMSSDQRVGGIPSLIELLRRRRIPLTETLPRGLAMSRQAFARPPSMAGRTVRRDRHCLLGLGHGEEDLVWTGQASKVTSSVIAAFRTFDTGQPAFALFASAKNAASSVPGTLATSVRCTSEIANPPSTC